MQPYIRTLEHRELMRQKSTGRKLSAKSKEKIRQSRLGKKASLATRRKMSKKGNKNNSWKGGGYRHSLGYIYAYAPDHHNRTKQGYVMKHRLVMESYLKTILPKEAVIHHIDGDKTNNNVNNLMLFPNHSEHLKYHHKLNRKIRNQNNACPN